MDNYNYLVQTGSGEFLESRVDASGWDEAAGLLHQRGYLVLSLEKAAPKRGGLLGGLWGRRINGEAMARLSRDLAMLIRGGIQIVSAVGMLEGRFKNPAVKKLLRNVAKDLRSGVSMSNAFSAYPESIPALFPALVELGEETGSLPGILDEYAAYLDRQEEMRRKIISAVTYPAIVILVALGVTFYLSFSVVPTFARMFETLHLELPWLTRAVVAFSSFLRDNLAAILVATAGGALFLNGYLRTEGGRRILVRTALSAPVLRSLFENAMLLRFFSTFSVMIKSGVSVMRALGLLKDIFRDNPVYHDALQVVTKEVAVGNSISGGMKKAGIFPEMTTEAVRIGEEAGNLGGAMDHMAVSHAQQLEYCSRQLPVFIEPAMTLLVGTLIGVIMFALFMPMLEMLKIRPG